MFLTLSPQVDGIIEQRSVEELDKFVNSQVVRNQPLPHLLSPQLGFSRVRTAQPCTRTFPASFDHSCLRALRTREQ
jgi:hypothetical protein